MNIVDEVSKGLARNVVRKHLESKIFEMVYQWGRTGIVADAESPAYKHVVSELEAVCANTQ